jgi:hypothetical protein
MNANGKSAARDAPLCAAIQHTSVATALTFDASAFEHELGYLDPDDRRALAGESAGRRRRPWSAYLSEMS